MTANAPFRVRRGPVVSHICEIAPYFENILFVDLKAGCAKSFISQDLKRIIKVLLK